MHWYWQLKICIQSFINNPQNFNSRGSISFLICLRIPDLHIAASWLTQGKVKTNENASRKERTIKTVTVTEKFNRSVHMIA
jgi:hypothetical protein